ncbi:MAG: hypothetical protein ACI8RU_001411 [Zhongshania aliphaticivorans]|jgi:hypothetical protein
MDTCLRRYDEISRYGDIFRCDEIRLNRRPCEGRGPSQQQSAALALSLKTCTSFTWIPAYAGMTKFSRYGDIFRCDEIRLNRRPCEGRGPSQQQSAALVLSLKACTSFTWMPAYAGMTKFPGMTSNYPKRFLSGVFNLSSSVQQAYVRQKSTRRRATRQPLNPLNPRHQPRRLFNNWEAF